jgi:hypothetical protein
MHDGHPPRQIAKKCARVNVGIGDPGIGLPGIGFPGILYRGWLVVLTHVAIYIYIYIYTSYIKL